MPLPTRRALLASALLAGCGFQLRRPPTLNFARIQLVGFPSRSAFTEELKRSIEASGSTRVVRSIAEADAVLEALLDVNEKVGAALTAAGQVRAVTLRTRLKFRLRTPGGRVLIPDTELALSRDMSYNESDALAKEQEEQALYRDMQTDIVDQVMRRLAAVPAP